MKPTVLLLVRSEAEQANLRVLLDLRGFRVLATASVDQARQWLRDGSVELHAMVTDLPYGEPHVNIVGIRPDLRIVWLGAGESKVSAILRGASRFIRRRWQAFQRPRGAVKRFAELGTEEVA